MKTLIGQKNTFFYMEYWSKLKMRHNLDVVHIEKKICDFVLGTLLRKQIHR